VLIAALLLMLGLVIANLITASKVWSWCPQCSLWHSPLGDSRYHAPVTGRINGHAKLCLDCQPPEA
jgi:hypothetical protein